MVRKSDEAGSLLQRINELIEAVHKIGVWFAYRQALRRLGASAKRKATCDSVAAVSHLASIRESRSLACQLLACAHS
jgi:hypothetical protein